MAMINYRQMKSLIDQLTEELGRQPYSTELIAAINGTWRPKDKKDGSSESVA